MPRISKNCLFCNNHFVTEQKYINRGHGKYCTPLCASRGRPKKKNPPNQTCARCGTAFFRQPSHSKNSKSGLLFCSRLCKDSAQGINGMPELRLPHYGIGLSRRYYQTLGRRNLPQVCIGCGYDRNRKVLDIHHIDENKFNNSITNLAMVCPTCHREIHVGVRSSVPPFPYIDGGEARSSTGHGDFARVACTAVPSPD